MSLSNLISKIKAIQQSHPMIKTFGEGDIYDYVDNGGETVFSDLKIVPKKGNLLVFPPLWMFPHRGNPPISGPKYIMSGYLEYI